MTLAVSLLIAAIGILLIGIVIKSIVKKKITERQGLLWLLAGLIIVVGGLFPDLTKKLAAALGVVYAPSLIFTLAILAIYFIVFLCTLWISGLTANMQELAMQVALLNHENSEMRAQLQTLKGPGKNFDIVGQPENRGIDR